MELEVSDSLLKTNGKGEREREMRLKELFHRTEPQWLEILEKKACGIFEMRWDDKLNGVVLYNKSIKRGIFLHVTYAHTIGEESIKRKIYSNLVSKYHEPLKDALSYIRFPKELHKEIEQLLSFSIDKRKHLALYCEIFNKKIARLQ